VSEEEARVESGLKAKILANELALTIRTESRVDEDQWEELRHLLQLLAKEWQSAESVDKELVECLYTTSQALRNSFVAHSQLEPRTALADRLEDLWVDVDALVLECLTEPSRST
jgi:predicted metal-binding protein